MLSWESWKQKYSKQIEHVAGYEEGFVDNVLSKIPEINPEDVFPQYHFIDDHGGNRYIDFMINNEDKGYYLPIELDGTYKDTNHQRWKDFLVRQNSLITKFGIVLRFSNKQMLWDSPYVINKIRDTLNVQAQNQVTEASKEKERESLVSWYHNELSKLEDSNSDSIDITMQIQELRSLVEEVQVAQSLTQQESTDSFSTNTGRTRTIKRFGTGLGAMLAILLMVFITNEFFTRTHTSESSALKSEVEVTEPTVIQRGGLNTVDSLNTKTDSETFDAKETMPLDDVNSWEEVTDDEIESTLSQGGLFPTGAITSDMSSQYVGTLQLVCGEVSQVTVFSQGTYLNFDKQFPDTVFTGVIWNSDSKNVLTGEASFYDYLNQKVCVSGKVGVYNGRFQVVVKSSSQLKIF
ncbi:hypothetical protein [Vibrio crassostreae]|uniref:hypothetical protein n=1 Tax=Vibrio crassostreae TaxID=246167 RepID=UPI001B305C4B|nr:hypothetical protein [Vibrio crassostreae]